MPAIPVLIGDISPRSAGRFFTVWNRGVQTGHLAVGTGVPGGDIEFSVTAMRATRDAPEAALMEIDLMIKNADGSIAFEEQNFWTGTLGMQGLYHQAGMSFTFDVADYMQPGQVTFIRPRLVDEVSGMVLGGSGYVELATCIGTEDYFGPIPEDGGGGGMGYVALGVGLGLLGLMWLRD